MRQAIIGLTGLLLMACDGPAQEAAMAPVQNETTPQVTENCAVLDSRNWQAWVNAMPGPDAQPTLHVTGDVDLPTPGYTIEWRLGALDRMQPPGQRLVLSTTPPDGIVTQVVTTVGVAFAGETTITEYREVIVTCGGSIMVEIIRMNIGSRPRKRRRAKA